MQLRPYQQQAIDDLRTSLQSHRAALYVLPTGGGKTRISAEIIRRAVANGKRVMFAVHRIELIAQTSKALTDAGIEHAINTDAAVSVVSIFTIARRLHLFTPPDLFIQDEAHHAIPSNTWGRVLAWLPPQTKIIGVTATPQRLDGRGLGDIFECLVEGPTPEELINAGYLSQPILYGPPTSVNRDIPTRAGDFARELAEMEVDRPAICGEALNHYNALASGLQTLAFCQSVAHAEHVAASFSEAGIPAASVDGSLSASEREARILGFARGDYRVLTSCDLIGEGFDLDLLAGTSIPIGCILVLRLTKSLSLWLQMLGRGLRPHADKSHTVIIDAVGNWKDLGLPQTPRQWKLTKSKTKKRTADDLAIKQCPQCFAVAEPSAACLQCGFIYPVVQRKMIETVDGVLVPIDSETARVEIERRRKLARSFDDLLALQHAAGYANGWAHHVWNARMNRKSVGVFTR